VVWKKGERREGGERSRGKEGGRDGGRGDGEKHELILFCEDLSCKVPLTKLASPPSPVASASRDVNCWGIWCWNIHEVTQITQEHKVIRCMLRPLSCSTLLRFSRVSRSSRPADSYNMYNSDQCTPVTRSSHGSQPSLNHAPASSCLTPWPLVSSLHSPFHAFP